MLFESEGGNEGTRIAPCVSQPAGVFIAKGAAISTLLCTPKTVHKQDKRSLFVHHSSGETRQRRLWVPGRTGERKPEGAQGLGVWWRQAGGDTGRWLRQAITKESPGAEPAFGGGEEGQLQGTLWYARMTWATGSEGHGDHVF